MCLNIYIHNYNGLPDLLMDVDHQRLVSHTAVWPTAPSLPSAEVNFLTPSMTNNSTAYLTRDYPYLTCHSEAYLTHLRLTNASCNSRYQGILTPLSTLAVTRRHQLSPYQAEVDHFVCSWKVIFIVLCHLVEVSLSLLYNSAMPTTCTLIKICYNI